MAQSNDENFPTDQIVGSLILKECDASAVLRACRGQVVGVRLVSKDFDGT